MKINRSESMPFSAVARSNGAVPAGGSDSSSSTESTTGTDQLQLSNLSANLTATRSDSVTHFAKLSSLNAAVLNGGYQVDTGVVSDSIIRHSLQFGGANYF